MSVRQRAPTRGVLLAWVTLTAAMGLQAWLTWFGPHTPRLAALAAAGPGSNPQITAAAVFLAWLALGCGLLVFTSTSLSTGNRVTAACYLCLALLYVNVMRERTYYGDFDNYFSAALSLRDGTPLPGRYLYPPFWAGVLAPLTRLGEEWVFTFVWLLNLASTVLCFVLLPRVLERYGFGRPLALVATMAFGVVNVPLLRTLGYAQVNMEVLAAILLSLHWYPRSRLLSAIALAVAVNLKISPLVLASPFLVVRDWRWAVWFGVAVIAVGAWPGLAWGWEPYGTVLGNLRDIAEANGLAFRDASIDSWMRATGVAVGLRLEAAIWPAKIALSVACLLMAIVHVRHRTFVPDGGPVGAVLNAMPSLLILMVMVSPLVWEHHPVLLGLSYLLIATTLKPTDWPLFGLAYFLEFLMPTFDFYPWSYGRLASPVILLALAWRRRAEGPPQPLLHANRRLGALLARWSTSATSD